MLSATRRRVLPASLLATGAIAAGVLGTSVPAQASATTRATTSVVTRSVASAAVAPTTVSPAVLVARKAAAARIAVARVAHIRFSAVSIARSKVGSRYSAGHAGPTRFDCSGLALYVVKKATGRTLPHYSRAQMSATKRVGKGQLRPGDLVFFFRHGAHHVGVYIGAGRMVSATNPHGGVKVDAVFSGWYGSRYSGAGRLV